MLAAWDDDWVAAAAGVLVDIAVAVDSTTEVVGVELHAASRNAVIMTDMDKNVSVLCFIK